MLVQVLGLNHTTASIALREQLTFLNQALSQLYQALYQEGEVLEAVVVCTCNRTELYVITQQPWPVLKWLSDWVQQPLESFTYTYQQHGAFEHLLRVLIGLDSKIVGETPIVHQIKAAWDQAAEIRSIPQLRSCLDQALHKAKNIRLLSKIDQFHHVISLTIFQLASHIFMQPKALRVLCIGAGAMITELVPFWQHRVQQLTFINRTLSTAQQLAERYQAQALPWEQLTTSLGQHDLIIIATSAGKIILTEAMIRQALKSNHRSSVLLIDLALPRNVAPSCGALKPIFLYHIDALQDAVAKQHQLQRQRLEIANQQVELAVDEWQQQQRIRALAPQIKQLTQRYDELQQQQVQLALKHWQAGATPQQVLTYLAKNITKHCMHDLLVSLRTAAKEGKLTAVQWLEQWLYESQS